MAILHRKEEKIQVVLGRLPKKYTHEEFVEMFIKLYSKDWGKIKSAYVKQSKDKEPGTVVNMPKPDLYLKQLLSTYLSAKAEETKENEKEPVKEPKPIQKKKLAVENKQETVAQVKKKTPTEKKSDTGAAPLKTKRTKAIK